MGLDGGERRELKSLWRYLTNREMPKYFKETRISKSHKLHGVVGRHCLALDFVDQMGESEADHFRDSFWEFVSTIDELLNTDPLRGAILGGGCLR